MPDDVERWKSTVEGNRLLADAVLDETAPVVVMMAGVPIMAGIDEVAGTAVGAIAIRAARPVLGAVGGWIRAFGGAGPGRQAALKGLSVIDDGFAMWVKVADDPKAIVRIEQAADALHVTDLFRGGLPPGSGSQLLAEGLKASGLRSGQRVVLSGIVNAETVAAHAAGERAANSLLGRCAAKALEELGLKASSAEFQVARGKLNIVIEVK